LRASRNETHHRGLRILDPEEAVAVELRERSESGNERRRPRANSNGLTTKMSHLSIFTGEWNTCPPRISQTPSRGWTELGEGGNRSQHGRNERMRGAATDRLYTMVGGWSSLAWMSIGSRLMLTCH
jgi:hypothetical protein